MQQLEQWIRSTLTALVLAPAAFAGTWIVDAAGGPGVHFTDIPPAVAAAAPGDVILVRGGAYSPFVISKGLTVIGTPGVWPTGTFISCCLATPTVTQLPAGAVAVLADLDCQGKLELTSNQGTVVLDHVSVREDLRVRSSLDVRFLHVQSRQHCLVEDSGVEVVASTLVGSDGFGIGGSGRHGLRLQGTTSAVLARTDASGGEGVSVPIGLPGDGGDGGHGIWISAPARLVLAGGGVATVAGGGGGDTYFGFVGEDGHGLFNDQGGVWRSGTTFLAGAGFGGNGLPILFVPGAGGFDQPVTPDDPTLELVGSVVPGGTVQLVTHAPPGTVVRTNLGIAPLLVPVSYSTVPRRITRNRSYFLGLVPASGQVSLPLSIPAGYKPGTRLFLQSRVFDPATGGAQFSNSVPLIVR